MEIKIKAYFSDWKTVDIETAKRFIKLIQRPWDKKVFNNHFRGTTYEELSGKK